MNQNNGMKYEKVVDKRCNDKPRYHTQAVKEQPTFEDNKDGEPRRTDERIKKNLPDDGAQALGGSC